MSHEQQERERLASAQADVAAGLTTAQVLEFRREHGRNVLVPSQKVSLLSRLLRPLPEPMVIVLLGAAVAYLLLGDRTDALIMLVALVPIAAVDCAFTGARPAHASWPEAYGGADGYGAP